MKKPVLRVFLSFLCFSLFAQNTDLRGLNTVVSQLEGETAVVGKQYAVLIAVDRYKNWIALRNPVEDAKEIKEILSRRYFVSNFLELYDEAATKAGIIKLFNRLISTLEPEDSILIFYAGHGHLDKTSNTGFWIPVDGGTDADEQANWLPNAQIRGFISNMKAQHVALIADSCFSGDFLNPTRGMTQKITNQYFKNAYARISRQVLTSGASESVPDESQFVRQLKLALEGNTSPYLDPLMLYNQIRLGVTRTTPLFGDLKDSGHQEGSSFLLFLRDQRKQPAPGEAASSAPQAKTTFKLEKVFGKVSIETNSTGTLLLDGVEQGQVPAGRAAAIENVELGTHELEMRYENGETEKIPVTLESEEAVSVKFTNASVSPPAELMTGAEVQNVPAPEETATPQDTLVGRDLPHATIKIDGNFEDWNGILPAFSHKGNAKKGNLAIDKVYLAVDEKNLYMRFDVKDATPSSFFHPHNFYTSHFVSYGLDLQNGMIHLGAECNYDPRESRFYVEIPRFRNNQRESLDKTFGNFGMKGSSFEASFPLEIIKKNLGVPAVGGYVVIARDGYIDGRWIDGDRTTAKMFVF